LPPASKHRPTFPDDRDFGGWSIRRTAIQRRCAPSPSRADDFPVIVRRKNTASTVCVVVHRRIFQSASSYSGSAPISSPLDELAVLYPAAALVGDAGSINRSDADFGAGIWIVGRVLAALAFRRAADANVSEWIAAATIVPVVQIPAILFCVARLPAIRCGPRLFPTISTAGRSDGCPPHKA